MNDDERGYISRNNAFMNENEMDENGALNVFNDFSLSTKMILIFIAIGICCGLFSYGGLVCFGIYYRYIERIKKQQPQRIMVNRIIMTVIKQPQPKKRKKRRKRKMSQKRKQRNINHLDR